MDTEKQNEQPEQDSEKALHAEQMQQLRDAQELINADKRKRESEFRSLLEQAGKMLRCKIRATIVYGGVEHDVPLTVVAL